MQEYAATYSTREEWEKRAATISEGILKQMQLSPLPGRASLKAVIHSKRVHNGYSVENVYFESFPGFFVTGNLYRPTSGEGPFPAILTPHGHWRSINNYGRFRKDKQMNNATLARMGAVCFAWDMVGYGESLQTKHCFKELMALQTWNSIRIIDFLQSLPYVDSAKIGISGASGGGTQSILATAVDKRIKVSIPVVMVSAYYFGGCNGESGMEIHDGENYETNNAEIAALAAPRPLMLISDGKDWSQNTPEMEYPYAKNIYKLYDAEDKVENLHLGKEGHDLGPSKRAGAYAFFKKHFNLGEIPDESGNTLEPMDSLRVWSGGRKWPGYALKTDDAIRAGLFFKGAYGCKDSSMGNYNPNADVHDSGLCREKSSIKPFAIKTVLSRQVNFTTISFNIHTSQPVTLDIVSLKGVKLHSPAQRKASGANNTLTFELPKLPAGVYFLYARSGAWVQVDKVFFP